MTRYTGTSLRSRPVAQTLRLARPLMPALGISRLTDITRLDRLGMPVFTSVRPRGLTLRVHAGKGIRAADARVGALMEAIEFAVAERASASLPDATATLAALEAQWPDGLRVADFAPRLGVAQPPLRSVAALRCEDVAGGPAVLLPAELVSVPSPAEEVPVLFGWTTNGLASGNDLDEATLHALLEVLERDTLALNKARDTSALVDNMSLPPPFHVMASAWLALGVKLIVRHLPNTCGLPCFEAHLHEPGSLDVNLAGGSGLHFERGIALARAVCEAAQSRLSTIHGGRDDLTRFYAKHAAPHARAQVAAEVRVLAALRDDSRRVRFDEIGEPSASASAQRLPELLAELARQGLRQVYRRRFTGVLPELDSQGLHVVKLVVPRCESALTPHARLGPRLLARVLGHD